MPDIDWSKPVECSYRHEETVYYPVVFHAENPNHTRTCVLRRPNGHHFVVCQGEGNCRFRNVRRKVKRAIWVNLYADRTAEIYDSKEDADLSSGLAGVRRVECRNIEWEADADE